jgi:hypothetical protein
MPEPNPPDELAYLDCDHCGGVAIESESGLFGDGDGGHCLTCGLRGRVSVDDSDDENVSAYWSSSDDPDDKCNEKDCVGCYG